MICCSDCKVLVRVRDDIFLSSTARMSVVIVSLDDNVTGNYNVDESDVHSSVPKKTFVALTLLM